MISLILIAGGKGARMGQGALKQFRLLRGKPVALHCCDLFAELDEISECVVVCEPVYQSFFTHLEKPVRFASPGARRQDSVYQGLVETSPQSHFICIHDAVRPFVEKEALLSCIAKAKETRAAALAVPVSDTIKCVEGGRVINTLKRETLWVLQTPQIIDRSLLFAAYEHARLHQIEVTDDLSLVEAMGHPTYVVKSSPSNFKITTPFDWNVACALS